MNRFKKIGFWGCFLLTAWISAPEGYGFESDQVLFDRAFWIWHTRDSSILKQNPYFFKKEIHLDDTATFSKIHVTAEGYCSLTVNGTHIGTDGKWHHLAEYDVTPFLKHGKNTFEVKVIPDNWYAGLFVAGKIKTERGTVVEILSDSTWDTWSIQNPAMKKADPIVQGIDGGFWNNVTPVEMPELHNRLNVDLTAPHIPWAKPYGGEKPRVLAIFPRQVQRDMVELIHRFEMDVTVVFSDYYPEDRREPFFRAVKGALKQDVVKNIGDAFNHSYDVILLGNIAQDIFHEAVSDRLKAALQSGAGLIYSRFPNPSAPDDSKEKAASFEERIYLEATKERPDFLFSGVPFEKLKVLENAISFYRSGNARIAKVHRIGKEMMITPDDGKNDLFFEYYQAYMIKLILWAARKEPTIRFTNWPERLQVKRNTAIAPELVFTLKETPELPSSDLALEIRSLNTLFNVPSVSMSKPGLESVKKALSPIYRETRSLKSGDDVRWILPILPAGDYFVDIFALKDGKKRNWSTSCLRMDSEILIRQIQVNPTSLDFSKENNPELTVSVHFNKVLPADGTLRLSVIDNHDRLVNDVTLNANKGRSNIEHRFKVSAVTTTLLKVRAELTLEEMRVDISTISLTALRPRKDRFAFAGWANTGIDSRQQRVLARVLAGLGFDAQRGAPGSFDRLEVADILAFPGAGGKRIAKIDIDPGVLGKAKEETQALAKRNLPFDPFGYVTGDEVSYGGGEELPSRIDAFREQLKKTYGSIDALNTQWGTEFSFFNQIPAITPKTADTMITKAKETLNFSPMVDQFLENCRVYAEQFGFYQKTIADVDPQVPFGIESPLWPWADRHLDWYAILQNIRLFSPYGRECDLQTYEYARSFARPGTILGMTYGGYIYNGFVRRPQPMDPEFQYWRPWNALMRGFNMVYWYHMGPFIESGVGMGLQPYPAFLTAVEQIEQIRKGYHTLFHGAERIQDPVAIHYSIASNVLSEHIKDFGLLPFNIHMLLRILQDYVPVGYTFLSTPQIESGGLNNYKVLIMPLSQAVSEKEAMAIRSFVEKGGLIIADVRPGICDGHGKFGANTIMQKIFGITHGKTLGRRTIEVRAKGEFTDSWFEEMPASLPVDPSIQLKDAYSLLEAEGIPLVTIKRSGKGAAVCLNIPFNYYQRYPTPDSLYFYLADPSHAKVVGNILKTLLETFRVDRSLEIKTPRNAWPMGLESWHFKNGEAFYIGLTKRRMKKEEPGYPVRIYSPAFGHVYDMLTGQYLGEKNTWQIELKPADVRLFSILPCPVQGVDVELSQKSFHRGGAVSGRVRIKSVCARSVHHVICLEILRPDGEKIPYLMKNLETDNGLADFMVELALNDPSGQYSLVFTDIATQIKKVVKIDVV